ncbi:Rib/alpha-like domain-containing protein [Gardnerella piotii]
MDVNITILNRDSDSYEPTAKTLTKKHGETISNDDITNQVSVPNYPSGKKQPTKTVGTETTLPNTNTPGESDVPVTVKYPDGTTDTVNVHVVVKDADANTHTPQAEPLERNIDSGKPSDSDITSKVTIPNWPAGEKDKPTYSIADGDKSKIPAGDKAGKFEVPVTVTYPDGSKTVINVPVNIGNPTATAKVVTVPMGVEPKPEDSIANKDKFPDGTIFEWTEKPDTSEEGNNKSGKVKITIPGSTTQEVPVKVNVVDPSASEVNVPQGKQLPKAEDVIKNKFPDGTQFEWKSEDKPDTNNPGPKSGKIIITIPGQSPVEVPVTVNVLPTPEAKVVNVPQNGTLPDAKTVIKDSNDTSKFPEGTKFDWKTKPDIKQSGKDKQGKITVTIPGVNVKKDYTVDVDVTVNVTPEPTAKETTVAQNSDPDPKNSIGNNGDFPEGTTFTWGTGKDGNPGKPDTSKTGNNVPGTVVVTVPGQEPQNVKVKINVTPAPEVNNVTVLQKKDGDTTSKEPNAEDVIKNKGDFPRGTKFEWKKDGDKETGKPDTSHVGNQPGVVTVKVPGEPNLDIPVNVLVVPNPKGKTVNVPQNGDVPEPKDMIDNNGDFPQGATFEWKKDGDGKETGKPSTSTTGAQTGTVVVTIPGVKDPVEVKVTVNVTDKPFINDSSAKNTPDNPNKTTITGKTQPGNTVTVKEGESTVGTPVTADEKGNFTIEIDKKDAGTTLKLVPSKDGKSGTPVEVAVIAKPKAPTITVPSENEDGKLGDGNVTVTPTKDDNATVVTIVITAKPNPLNGPEQPVRTIVVKKGDDGTWKKDGDVPEGVTVDETTGEVTIPAKDLEDGSTITAVAKDKDDHSSDKAEKTTGFKTPQITGQSIADEPSGSGSESGGDQGGSHGSQKITGKTDVPGATITVTDKDGKQIGTGKADKDGNFTITINKQTPGTIVNLTPTKGTGDFAKTGNTVEVTVGGDIAVPRIDTPADGSATITPNLTDTRVDKVVITYTPEGDGSTPQTVTVTVIAEGDMRVWKIDGTAPNGVTVDPNTGVVTIPAANVKDGSTITAFAKNSTDNTAEGSSSTVTGTIAQPGGSGSGSDDGSGISDDGSDSGESDSGTNESGSHTNNGSNANNTNNANKNGNKNDVSGHNGGNNHGNQSRNSGSNSESRRGKGALGNTGVGVALSALASAMLAGMGAAGRAVSRRKKRN